MARRSSRSGQVKEHWRQFCRRFEYIAYEPDEASSTVARRRLDRIGTGQVINDFLPDHPDRQYDVVAAFEVLEHMKNDREALHRWATWLRPGGDVLLSVPANPRRFGAADRYAGHYRRYTKTGLRSVMIEAGTQDPEIAVYGMPLGYLLERVRNRIASRKLNGPPVSPEERTIGSGGRLQIDTHFSPLVWATTLPFAVIQRPFESSKMGIGFVAQARKPDFPVGR